MPREPSVSTLILASSSPYRKLLLERLQLPFTCRNPEIDEQAFDGESAVDLVTRLAQEKALAVSAAYDNGLVIGSDQVAELDDRILTKPGTHARAIAQLADISGRTVTFHTGLCVVNARSGTLQCESVPFSVTFRSLSDGEIERYLVKEQPYDCAGSFRFEGLGISLLEKTAGEDATALIGLPLLRLSAMLRAGGLAVP